MALECCDGHYYEVELVCDTKEDLDELFALVKDRYRKSHPKNGIEVGTYDARCEHGNLEHCEEEDNDYTCTTEE